MEAWHVCVLKVLIIDVEFISEAPGMLNLESYARSEAEVPQFERG